MHFFFVILSLEFLCTVEVVELRHLAVVDGDNLKLVVGEAVLL